MLQVKILIVEDDIVTSERIAFRLEEIGYKVCAQKTTGEDALLLLEKEKPDLILMDIILAGKLDGIKTAEKIREKYEIPIIYLTALDDRATMLRAGKTNPENYIQKPYRLKDIRIAIDFAVVNFSFANDSKSSTFFVKDSFFVKKKAFYEKIQIDNVLWIEADGNYINIMISGGLTYNLSMTLKKFSRQFTHPNLIRVSRSFIINRLKVDMIKGRQLVIAKKSIPFSTNYLVEIEKYWPIIKTQ